VNNIMAYSWPSHCKRYLESIEMEKRFLRRHLVSFRSLAGARFLNQRFGEESQIVTRVGAWGQGVAGKVPCGSHYLKEGV
jgi:hypothetical protein